MRGGLQKTRMRSQRPQTKVPAAKPTPRGEPTGHPIVARKKTGKSPFAGEPDSDPLWESEGLRALVGCYGVQDEEEQEQELELEEQESSVSVEKGAACSAARTLAEDTATIDRHHVADEGGNTSRQPHSAMRKAVRARLGECLVKQQEANNQLPSPLEMPPLLLLLYFS